MNPSTVNFDTEQYPNQSALKSLINKIKHHDLFQEKLQIDTSSIIEANKIIGTPEVSIVITNNFKFIIS